MTAAAYGYRTSIQYRGGKESDPPAGFNKRRAAALALLARAKGYAGAGGGQVRSATASQSV
eukprot:1607940-Pleurochrysis_carterae.AAC.2